MSWFLTLVAALAALHAHGTLKALPRPGFRVALRAFGVGSLAIAAALALASRGTLAPVRPLLLTLAAAAGLVAWGGLIRLVSFETRKRDVPGRILALGLAALGSAFAWPPGLVGAIAATAVMSWRWKRELPTRSRFTVGVGALVSGMMLVIHTGHVFPGGALGATARALNAFARTVLIVSAWYALFGALVLLRAWVSDPSLGIRRVSHRLALSHVLVGLVPVLLLGALWFATTVLGVLNERAIVGTRAIAAQGRWYKGLLSVALEDPASAEVRLARLPALVDSTGAIGVWRRTGGALHRVAGGPAPHEERVAAWLDSLRTLPHSGLLVLGDSLYLGAAVADARGDGAVLLAPVRAALRSQSDSIARAELGVWRDALVRTGPNSYTTYDANDDATPADSAALALAALGGARDSARAARARDVLRRLGAPNAALTFNASPKSTGPKLSAGNYTYDLNQGGSDFLMQGHTMADGLQWRVNAWHPVQLMAVAHTPLRDVLMGLIGDARANPMGLIPLVLVGFFALLAALVIAWDLVMVRGMGRSITQAVAALDGAAARLRAGDLSHRIAIAGEDDLWQVAAAFNTATDGLERARVAEREHERVEAELDVARRIQERLLPADPPHVQGLEVAGLYDPAREVGGDYYDHIALDEHRVLLVIADVSGKSVPAALIMAGFRAALVSQSLPAADLPGLARRLNGFLNDSLESGKFVTAFIAVVDGVDGRMSYVNAGHNPPVLLRRGGHHELLEAGGTILGILPGSRYERGETRLEVGDVLVLYTDGVPEGTSPASELWGDERLLASVVAHGAEPCARLVRSIAGEVRAFEGERGPADDVTLIAVRRLPA